MSLVSRLGRLVSKTGKFWIEAYALYLAAVDRRVPLYARVAAAAFAIYILSPIDIVPDPIPVIGIVDDFLIIPLGLIIIRSLAPEYLRLEHRDLAITRQPQRPGFTEAYRLVFDTLKRVPYPLNISARDVPRRVTMKWR